jgi:hypothetical protein
MTSDFYPWTFSLAQLFKVMANVLLKDGEPGMRYYFSTSSHMVLQT